MRLVRVLKNRSCDAGVAIAFAPVDAVTSARWTGTDGFPVTMSVEQEVRCASFRILLSSTAVSA